MGAINTFPIFAKLFKSITPEHLLTTFIIVGTLGGIMTLILLYHWNKYSFSLTQNLLVKMVYMVGFVAILFFMFTAYSQYSMYY